MSPCNCKKNDTRYEVVASSGSVVYSTNSQTTAESVSKRYRGSTVRKRNKVGT